MGTMYDDHFKLKYEVNELFYKMNKSQIARYVNLNTFRACFTAHGNFVFDAPCKLILKEDNNIEIAIHDGNRMRDKDCDMIVIMSYNDETLFKLYYKPSEFIQEFGTINIQFPL